MAKLLDSLGEGYRYRTFPLEDLGNPSVLAEFDVVFLTCSGVPESWLKESHRAGDRPNTEMYTPNEEVIGQVTRCLSEFVARGGTLYVSDLHYSLVANGFPKFVDLAKAKTGQVQTLTAEVVNPGLSELIGPELELQFDQPGWRPAAFAGESVEVYLRGTFTTSEGEQDTAPLLAKFPHEEGTVIFTSFHNEKQHSEKELQLLKFLVFSAVTAEVEKRVNTMMVKGGYALPEGAVQRLGRGADRHADLSLYQTRPAAVRAGLSQCRRELRLTVIGPDKKKHEREGTATFTIDIPDAATGDWTYTVTALRLPNENFPFQVTVGEK